MKTAVAEDRAASIDPDCPRKIREPSTRFLDDDSEGSVIPWAATEQHHAVEQPGCHEQPGVRKA